MFDRYADTIVFGDFGTDVDLVARAAEHIDAPLGPVRVEGGPDTAKVFAISRAARQAGFEVLVVNTTLLDIASVQHVRSRVFTSRRPVVLFIEIDGPDATAPHVVELGPALRDLADHQRVQATFVIHTT